MASRKQAPKWIVERDSLVEEDIHVPELEAIKRATGGVMINSRSAAETNELYYSSLPFVAVYHRMVVGSRTVRSVICRRCHNNSKLSYQVFRPGEFTCVDGGIGDEWLCSECHGWDDAPVTTCPVYDAGHVPRSRRYRPMVPVRERAQAQEDTQ